MYTAINQIINIVLKIKKCKITTKNKENKVE